MNNVFGPADHLWGKRKSPRRPPVISPRATILISIPNHELSMPHEHKLPSTQTIWEGTLFIFNILSNTPYLHFHTTFHKSL